MTNPLADWVAELAAELGVDPAALDRDLVLDVARDAAHGIARPAAPLTTFLVGLRRGRAGRQRHRAAPRGRARAGRRLSAGQCGAERTSSAARSPERTAPSM
jgi:hypothetical protein